MNALALQRSRLLAACIAGFTASLASGAHPLAQWHPRLTLPSGSLGFSDVAWGSGRFVAVAYGRAATSTNGSEWEVHDTGVAGYVRAVAYGGNRFVAVGLDGLVMSSADGIHWTQHTAEPQSTLDLYNVIYGGGLFVACGEFGRIVTSPEGVTWSSQNSGASYHLFDITHGQGQFLAALSPGTNLVSADGTNWQRRAFVTADNLYTVGYGGGQFLAVDIRLQVWLSTDALTWAPHGRIDGIRPPRVGWGNGLFLILANPAPEYATLTGSWTRSETNLVASGVAFGLGTFVLASGPSLFQSDPVIHLEMTAPGSLSVSGPPGDYGIESSDLAPGVGPWQWRTNLSLTTSPLGWTDTRTNGTGRLYRAIW